MRLRTGVTALGIVLACLVGGGIALYKPLPSLANRSTSVALSDTSMTPLGRAISPLVDARPGLCGVYALADGREAFAARMLLTQTAQRSLDVQYYIWRRDMSGMLFFDALLRAAERGVRVRLMLDDNNTAGLDGILSALDSHPNIEVRLFNPFTVRHHRWFGYLTDFSRLNRRMHNKSFTADNQVTILGGRNIGDEYFGATTDVAFVDLDVMAVGPVVREVSSDFDRYWRSDSSFPIDRLMPAHGKALDEVASEADRIRGDPEAIAYLNAVRTMSFVRDLAEGALSLEWATTRMVSDDPAKGLGRSAPEAALPAKLKAIFGEPAWKIDLVSPYFVPTSAGVDSFADMARRGVKIRILTNALEATDVPAVHAGYARRRKALLKAGIALFESRRLSLATKPHKEELVGSSSASSLHAKTFAVDGKQIFIGSFNFDPRSSQLNTEMGFVIASAPLARRMSLAFDAHVRTKAYEVHLARDRSLYWLEREGTQVKRHDAEPGTTFWQRSGVQLLSVLPIESLL